MKYVKKTKRKKYYHTKECMVFQKLGEHRFRQTTDEEINTLELELCGHCRGVEQTQGDRSYYLKAKELGESNGS